MEERNGGDGANAESSGAPSIPQSLAFSGWRESFQLPSVVFSGF